MPSWLSGLLSLFWRAIGFVFSLFREASDASHRATDERDVKRTEDLKQVEQMVTTAKADEARADQDVAATVQARENYDPGSAPMTDEERQKACDDLEDLTK